MSRKELHKEWTHRIALFKKSEMTQSEWCDAKDVNIHQLRYWLKKINKSQATSTEWVPMGIEKDTLDDSEEVLKVQVGQAIIEVKSNFNPAFLANLIKVLQTLC